MVNIVFFEVRFKSRPRLHRSLLVSISPNSSLLPPLLEVAADVAEAAEDTVEKATDGLLARTFVECTSCLQLIMKKGIH